MQKYTVIAVLGLNPGTVVGLSHKQAAPRAHLLKPIELDEKAQMGKYEVLARVEFKVGETIYTAATLNKALATALEPEATTKEKAADKKRSEAEAKDIAALREKAKQWDEIAPTLADLQTNAKAWTDLQPELDGLQTKAALWDRLPEAVRAKAVQDAEAELKADTKAKR